MMTISPEKTGFSGQTEQKCATDRTTATTTRNLPNAAWITNEAVVETIHVWSPYYGRNLTEHEAVEILMNLKNLVDTLSQNQERKWR
ncbi:MAG: hypothetical protein FWD53_05775 [Phycisphaerales bacterium]|nr:hypothetical protein [Phycisphaerales bacterium]